MVQSHSDCRRHVLSWGQPAQSRAVSVSKPHQAAHHQSEAGYPGCLLPARQTAIMVGQSYLGMHAKMSILIISNMHTKLIKHVLMDALSSALA